MAQEKKKEKGRAAFGWDVFNQDSLFKAYKKRLAKLPTVRVLPFPFPSLFWFGRIVSSGGWIDIN